MAEITIAANLAAQVHVGTPAILLASVTLTLTVAVRARIRIRVRPIASDGATTGPVPDSKPANRQAFTELAEAA
jgi:hypothetical protein